MAFALHGFRPPPSLLLLRCLSLSLADKLVCWLGAGQLPVVDDVEGVLGVVTLGNLTSKILSRQCKSSDTVRGLVFKQCRQAPLPYRVPT